MEEVKAIRQMGHPGGGVRHLFVLVRDTAGGGMNVVFSRFNDEIL